MKLLAALLVLLALAACGQGGLFSTPPRLTTPPTDPAESIGIGFSTVEVLDISLPDYAADDRIFVQAPGGVLAPSGAIWADDPARALTLELSLALAGITGERVAPEPWPFEEPPEAQVDVRLAEIVADASGAFVLRGQYFVASRDGSGRDTAEEFRIVIPLPPEPGPATIAAARARATVALAQEIAANGLR